MALVATLAEFKIWLKYGSGTADDSTLTTVLTSATQWLEWRIGGPIEVTSFTESMQTRGWSMTPRKRPLVAIASITPEGGSTALDSTTYRADTTNSIIRFPYGAPPGWYTTVYSAGLSAVTERHKTAGLEVARHLWLVQNGSSGRGFPGAADETPTPLGFAVPARAEQLLVPDLLGVFA